MATPMVEAVTSAVLERRTEIEARGDSGVLAFAAVVIPRAGVCVAAHRNFNALRDIFGSESPSGESASPAGEVDSNLAAKADAATASLLRIIHQCQMHTAVIERRLAFQSMLEELEKIKPVPISTDRGKKRKAQSTVETFPSDCWGVVAEFLPFADILQLPLISRQLFDDRDNVTWNTMFSRCFGVSGVTLAESSTWRREFKSRVCPMILATYGERQGGLPSVAKFLDEVAPKGSFLLGTKNLLITRTDPVRMIQATRHRSQTVRLDVDEISTCRGPVTVIAVMYCADGFQNMMTGAFSSPKMCAAIRRNVATVQHAITDAAGAK